MPAPRFGARWLVFACMALVACAAPQTMDGGSSGGGGGSGGGGDAAGGGSAGGGSGGGVGTGGGGGGAMPDAGAGGGGGSTADAGACTPLSGVVTSLQKGTYCVVGDVIIPTGVTLNVPAGTTFIVMGRFHFGRDVTIPDLEPPAIPGSGSLHAIGTAAEPIVFRGADATTGWYGILIAHTHDTVHLEYVTIRDTRKDDTDPSVRVWRRGGALNSYGNVKGTIIRHCTFVNNVASSVAGALAINGHGVWPDEGPVEVTDSLFEGNRCDCVTYAEASNDLCGGGAIRFSHIGGPASLVKLERNTFRDNEARKTTTFDAYGGAFGGFDCSLVLGPGNAFIGNRATTGDGAISCANHAQVGVVFDEVDPSNTFSGNVPDNGCGK